MSLHDLKVWEGFYDALASAAKNFEVRKNDRDFKVADVLHLREVDEKTLEYTGRSIKRRVSYILHGGQFGIDEGWCVMGLKLPY